MTTVSTAPTRAVATKRTRVRFALTESGANYVRVWCTGAPEGSKLAERIKKLGYASGTPRTLVFEGDGGSDHPWFYTFDKGGLYTLKAQEYTKGNAWGGGYLNDPRGAPTETKVGSEATLTVIIGERLTHQLGHGPDQATLVVWVWNDTIHETSVPQGHPERSPAIVSPTGGRAQAAAGATGVRSALSTFGGSGGSAIGNLLDGSSLLSFFVQLQATFDFHLTAAGRHNVDDTDNTVTTELSANVSPEGLPQALALLARRIYRHLTNDNGTGPGTSAYHRVSSNDRIDWLNVPIMMSCTPETTPNMIGDLARVLYEHAGGSGAPAVAIHGNNTTTSQLPTVGSADRLVGLHKAFFTALASNAPASTTGQGSLAARLASYGFKPS